MCTDEELLSKKRLVFGVRASQHQCHGERHGGANRRGNRQCQKYLAQHQMGLLSV
jgi:hypothetical protein